MTVLQLVLLLSFGLSVLLLVPFGVNLYRYQGNRFPALVFLVAMISGLFFTHHLDGILAVPIMVLAFVWMGYEAWAHRETKAVALFKLALLILLSHLLMWRMMMIFAQS